MLWLIKDQSMVTVINSFSEKSNANFQIDFSGYHNRRWLPPSDIYPYILWVLRTTQWVSTEAGKTVSPTICCLSKSITVDLSPFLEVPKVPNKERRFNNEKISQEDIEHVLTRVGVAANLGNFSTDIIYSILLRLQELNEIGDRVRAIYRQIVAGKSREAIDRTSRAYKSFFRDGKVLARIAGRKEYCPLNKVYYIEDRTFCQEIVDKFAILDLDTRAGKDKVKSILGVSPLADISFKANSEPILHQLNADFQYDFLDFLPYVYSLRVEKDPKHNQLSALKKASVTLCRAIEASYVFAGEEIPFQLLSFEHIFVGRSNNVYLKASEDLHETLYDLKRDVKFCEAISEIISGILRVEENRDAIRELYSKDGPQRDDVLRIRLDDDELASLKRARELFGITSDPQKDFWYRVLRAARPSLTIPALTNEEELKAFASRSLKLDEDYTAEMLRRLDCDDYNAPDNIPLLIALFKKIGMDVASFNQLTTNQIDLSPWGKMEVVDTKVEVVQCQDGGVGDGKGSKGRIHKGVQRRSSEAGDGGRIERPGSGEEVVGRQVDHRVLDKEGQERQPVGPGQGDRRGDGNQPFKARERRA